MKVSVLFCFFTGATGHISGHTPTRNTSLYVVLAKVVPFGDYKDEICNLTPFIPTVRSFFCIIVLLSNVYIGKLGILHEIDSYKNY